jgi:hypothetical protein
MKAGTLLFVISDLTQAMASRGIIAADGDFDETKLDTLQEDAEFAGAVEAILVKHGAHVPGRVDQVIKALPLVGFFLREPKQA